MSYVSFIPTCYQFYSQGAGSHISSHIARVHGFNLPQIGRPLPWPQSLPYLRRIRHAGVRQFLHVYDRLKDIEQDELLWGDEIEYGIFKVRRAPHQRQVSESVDAASFCHTHCHPAASGPGANLRFVHECE